MVNSFTGALQVIGVRAVINDVNKYLNSAKSIERANQDIAKSQELVEQKSIKAQQAQQRAVAGPSSAFRERQTKQIALLEKQIQSNRDKLELATETVTRKEEALSAARKKVADDTLKLAAAQNIAAKTLDFGPQTAAKAALTKSTQAEKVATDQLGRAQLLQKKAADDLIGSEATLAVTRRTQAADAAAAQLALDEKNILAKNGLTAANTRLEASEARLARTRFAGARNLALAGGIVAGAATAATFVASTKAASAFQDSLTKIDNLTSLTTEDTQRLGEQIRELTKVTPKNADDLGAAAYFIASRGGLTLKDTLDILTIANEAAVASFSSVEDTAKAITGVIQAYGRQNITAAQASDILFAAVKEGGAEFNDFVSQIGPVLPIARQLGVTFDQVAAAMATLTNVGISASESATALRAVMVQIFSPSQGFVEALKGAGQSVQQLRENVREKGLIVALQDLVASFDGNVAILDKLFPEVRGLTGAFALLRDNGAEVARIQDSIAKSQGITRQAFERSNETLSSQAGILKNQLADALRELGLEILPQVTQIVKELTRIFQENREGIKTFVSEALNLLIGSMKLAVQVVGAFAQIMSFIAKNREATRAAIIAIGAAFAWAMPGGLLIKGLITIVGLLATISNDSEKTQRKLLEDTRNKLQREQQYSINRLAENPSDTRERDKLAMIQRDIAKVEEKLGSMNQELATTGEIATELGDITLPKINAEFQDEALEEAGDRFKNFVDILEDGIISFEEATKPSWDGLIKGWDGVTAGGIEAFEFMRRELEESDRFAFNFQKTLGKIAVAFQNSERAGQKLVLTLAQETLAKTQAAVGAIFGRPTREVAELNLQSAQANLFQLQREQALSPALKAAQRNREALEEGFNAQLRSLQDQRDRIADQGDDEADANDRRLDALKDQADREEEIANDRIDALKKELDSRDEHLENLKQAFDDEMRAMDRANQLRDRETDDAIDALNKQKDFLEKRQDLAISPSQKRAIQKQIDAIDAEIESRRHSAEAADRQQEDREFQLREEQIAREREEDARKEALQSQIDAIEEEVEARKKNIENQIESLERQNKAREDNTKREVEALDDRIEALRRSQENELAVHDRNIKAIEGQIQQGQDLAQHFSDQTALLTAQSAIWEAEIALADRTLLTQEELRVLAEGLKGDIERQSQTVRDSAEALQVHFIQEVQDAATAAILFDTALRVATDETFRRNFIPNVDVAALHARLLADAAAAAADKLSVAAPAIAAAVHEAQQSAQQAAESRRIMAEQVTAQEQYMNQLSMGSTGGGGYSTPSYGTQHIRPPNVGGGGAQGVYDAVYRWQDLVAAHFPQSEVQKALNVMALESGGNPSAVKDDEIESSYGLFQINLDVHPLTRAQALDPNQNVAYAAQLWRQQGWRPWTAARQLGYAEEGGLVRHPMMMVMGEKSKPEMILPLTDIPRSRELMASVSPSIRAAILGVPTGGDTFYQFDNITLPNVARPDQFFPALEARMARELRFKKRSA